MAAFIKQVHETKRPLVITQRGRSAAVLIDAQEYEAMQEKIELLSDVQTALSQLEKGRGAAMMMQRQGFSTKFENANLMVVNEINP